MPAPSQHRSIFVEAPSGERFEAAVPAARPLKEVAAAFFQSQNWPLQDEEGRGQRAVVELVNPENPDDTRRLNADLPLGEAGVQDGDTLRIFPEAIAGAVDPRARQAALIRDQNDMNALSASNPCIQFTTNRHRAPDVYMVTFDYPSFEALSPGQSTPRVATGHQVEITLGADYPHSAPVVRWRTRIFHPNIRPSDGAVCLGVLLERYLPGMGLARLVHMLAEMVQYRNFDAWHALNAEAASWAANPDNWPQIFKIGGYPLQGPIEQWIRESSGAEESPIEFKPV